MAKAAKTPKKPIKQAKPKRSIFWWIGVMPYLALRWGLRAVLAVALIILLVVVFYAFVNPPSTAYIMSENWRLDETRREWRDFETISPHMPHAIVAAEDANFCNHWGFDMAAIRDALEDGGGRGASTISQQTVKNVFLWHGRNWTRKALEAAITPVMETVWTKRRILEVYMNVAEFDEGVFGVGAAAPWYFGVDAKDLSPRQASLLAAILPNPKQRSAKRPSAFVQKRARSIASGAATIRADGRNACFDG
ncbi:monofunctional biosynthetic peptidoglycan transglycosylase [Litoreibacter janthinus]|uniref:Biosynthetic peptidoglycan transglycosylase n=1 Tax=Litoreibacter janthinus TaxID=670154 RepID=A0A1I6G0P3_9RHOB|nr:monofunctional biosynthetic peptidoglycan transglycosylase [Litoreibacter janthinus]SFR35764.1 monofunctional biosynthetic peptidoglycan transglycosylase [Litoreibacter janthinus]